MDYVFQNNQTAQQIARETLSELNGILHPGMSEAEIARFVCRRMNEKGSGPFWYHGVGALVLLGERGRLSVSGRDYRPSEAATVSVRDVITVDCSPTFEGAWGDYARTFFIEGGVPSPEDHPSDPEFRRGMDAELHLHRLLTEEMNPDMTYEEVWSLLTEEIGRLGFVNLDFHGNLGHSIETDEKDRICLEAGNTLSIREHGKPFTLEPHIALPDGGPAYKRENIYFFDGDRFFSL